ncbi:NAD(P)/FAD-dependent oxidoreductase [Cryobacterium sp. M15]|uniref:flavin-containing monooxygenase n=1 Tax=Cryobacterium sp. M15 TaxID=2048291 RepID=UPI000CE3D7D9|nr:NAD(P)/FAD-dependent oxidoreductase [Cryobacterium sp. M15]
MTTDNPKVRPLDETLLRTAIDIANIPSLLMVLVQLTGEMRWLHDPYLPSRGKGLSPNDTGQLDSVYQNEVRSAAYAAILEWSRGREPQIPAPSPELLIRMLSVSMGEDVPAEYAEMMSHELGLDKAPRLAERVFGARPPAGFTALIIGAGASGLCAAIQLAKAGISYEILERNDEVGGTWLENRYPGCGVDTPSHLYSFSFAEKDWTRYFASRDELFDYFKQVSIDHDIRRHIRFRMEVLGAVWDEQNKQWHVNVMDADGRKRTLSASMIMSAVGAFNKPKIPVIPGLDTFEGPAAHTAQWPADLDLAGKRVGVIGNGASAMQLVPAVADVVESLTVFTRSKQWAAPFEQFKLPVPTALRYLFESVPLYRSWYRLRLAWTFNDRIHASLQRDPEWEHPERSINKVNDAHRKFFTRYIESELGDRQDLLPQVLPDYPPFGKRMLLDNGWFRTMTRDNVTLVADSITEVRAHSVISGDGTEHEVDVLVLATGFDVVRFLAPMEVRGRSGRTLESTWHGDDARAYLGLAVPDFPNFFCLYGPNTQFGHGGSLIFMMELQMHYIVDLLEQMFEAGIDSVDCKTEVCESYNDRVDEAHSKMVWTHPGMDVYYRNSKGRVVVNNPFKIVDFWRMLRNANLNEFEVTTGFNSAESLAGVSEHALAERQV